MQYAVLQPLPGASSSEAPAQIIAEWLGRSSGPTSTAEDAQRHLKGKALRLDSYVDPKDKEKRLARKRPPKRFKLSKTELKGRGLLDITQDHLTYHDGLVLNDLWSQYMTQIIPTLISSTHQQPNSIPYLLSQCNVIAVSDFHGAYIKIIQAKNPSTIGIEGIVMQETEQTFRVISQDNRIRTILKSDCIFHLHMAGKIFVLHGQHLCYRTAMRSKLKIKSKISVKLK